MAIPGKPPTSKVPKLRRHSTGQAFVEISGKRHYLGKFGAPDTAERYHILCAQLSSGRGLVGIGDDEVISINELIELYWQWCQSYYVKNGEPTSQVVNVRTVLRRLREFCGRKPVSEFGPKLFKLLRHTWIDDGLARRTVNGYARIVKHCFRWGVEEALVPASVFHGLQAVPGLARGRSAARETPPVKPVPESHIAAVEPFVSRQVWALIRLQQLTGARPGELLELRPCDIDTSGPVWCACLDSHKTDHHGRERNLFFGPKAQVVLRPFVVDRLPWAYVFNPMEATKERYEKAPTHRRPNQKRNISKTKRMIGDHYTTHSYRRAIARACESAEVPKWNPHRLRHNFATQSRKQFGIEATKTVLGHADITTTQIYAEIDYEKARSIAAKIG